MTEPTVAGTSRPSARFISVGTKLAVATFVLMALSTAAVYVGLSRFAREQLIAAKEEAARKAGQLFLRQASTPVFFDDATGIADTAALLGQDKEVLGVELWRASARGRIGERLAVQLAPGTAGLPPRWGAAPSIERLSDRIVFRDAVHDRDGRVIAVATVQYSLARENAAFATLHRRILAGAASVALVLTLLLLGVSRRSIVGPLARLLDAVKQVEAGTQVALGRVVAHDEVGRLGEAFGRMADAVARRERDIAARNQDMRLVLDNVGQGFLVVDGRGRLAAEHSAIVERWFGAPAAGQSIVDYLTPIDANAAVLLGLGLDSIAEDILPIDVSLGQLPHRLVQGDRHFACVYHLVGAAGAQQLVLVISDVTQEVEHERAERAQRDVMAALSRMLADRPSFNDFMQEARELVARLASPSGPPTLTEDLQDIHTLKGVAGIFGLEGLASFCHGLEQRAIEDQVVPADSDRARLRDHWELLERKLHSFGGQARPVTEVDREELDALVSAVRADAPRPQLLASLMRLYDNPALPRLERLAEHARVLAQRLGKGAITVDCDGGGVRLPHEPWHALWPTLAHVVRNAVDHGLESEDERLAAGKPAAGRVSLSAWHEGVGLVIVIADDGHGVDWDALAGRATALGLPFSSRDEQVAVMFSAGVSTRDEVSETSGRGVGLAAVRHLVEQLGGRIEVDSDRGRGTRFVFRFANAGPVRDVDEALRARGQLPVILRTDAIS